MPLHTTWKGCLEFALLRPVSHKLELRPCALGWRRTDVISGHNLPATLTTRSYCSMEHTFMSRLGFSGNLRGTPYLYSREKLGNKCISWEISIKRNPKPNRQGQNRKQTPKILIRVLYMLKHVPYSRAVEELH